MIRVFCLIVAAALLTGCDSEFKVNSDGNVRPEVPHPLSQEDKTPEPPAPMEVAPSSNLKERFIGTWEWEWDGPAVLHTFRDDGTMIITVGDFSRTEGTWEYLRESDDTLTIKSYLGNDERTIRFEGNSKLIYLDDPENLWKRAEHVDVRPKYPPSIDWPEKNNPAPRAAAASAIVPEWARWTIQYITTDLNEYARQLDHFNIELAALHKSLHTIEYARNLAKPTPDRRTGTRRQERGRRLCSWSKGSQLREFDETLLQRAGISISDHWAAQLLPRDMLVKLRSLELESLNQQFPNRNLHEVIITHFGVRKVDEGYEFFVKSHDFR